MVPVSARERPARQYVGRRLQTMRETAGITLEVAAHHLRLPLELLLRLEHGQHGLPPPLARAMTQWYCDPGLDVLVLARLVRNRGFEHDVAAWHHNMLAWEAQASRVCEVATTRIPELLQTPRYARAVFLSRTHYYRPTQEQVRAGVAALTLRQHRITTPLVLPVHVVITEQALRAPVAAATVLAAQWAHLQTVTKRHAVTIRVLPETRSGLIKGRYGWRTLDYAGMPEPRWLFRRHGYVTAPSEDVQTVARVYRRFLRLREASLSPEDSRAFIQQLISNLDAGHRVC